MLCKTCSGLAFTYLNKRCVRCQNTVNINISSLCGTCSAKDQVCSSCLKKIVPENQRKTGGCGCGSKK